MEKVAEVESSSSFFLQWICRAVLLFSKSASSLICMAVKKGLCMLLFLSLKSHLKITDLLKYAMILVGRKLIPRVSILKLHCLCAFV